MKALNWIAWISAGIGVLLMIFSLITEVFAPNFVNFFEHNINYFHAANSFFLITIVLFIYLRRCESKKE